MIMNLTEEEKRELLSKYDGKTSNELLSHLKRTYPIIEYTFDWVEKPVKYITINDKTYIIDNNKKFLVSKLFDLLEGPWVHIDKSTLRRTIKKFIDGYLL